MTARGRGEGARPARGRREGGGGDGGATAVRGRRLGCEPPPPQRWGWPYRSARAGTRRRTAPHSRIHAANSMEEWNSRPTPSCARSRRGAPRPPVRGGGGAAAAACTHHALHPHPHPPKTWVSPANLLNQPRCQWPHHKGAAWGTTHPSESRTRNLRILDPAY